MQSQLPVWVQYLQALTVPAIAALGLLIAVLQWVTAHQKVVLDLFERRMTIFEELRKALAPVVTHGKVTDDDAANFWRARDRARFLFGPEVTNYLDQLDAALRKHFVAQGIIENDAIEGDRRKKTLDIQHEAFTQLAAFDEKFPGLIAPFVRMHQKAPPSWYWRHRSTTQSR